MPAAWALPKQGLAWPECGPCWAGLGRTGGLRGGLCWDLQGLQAPVRASPAPAQLTGAGCCLRHGSGSSSRAAGRLQEACMEPACCLCFAWIDR